MAAGAADTGLIDIARESMASYRGDLLKVLPETVCALCLVFRVNQTALRSTEHSIADLELKEEFLNANHIICGVGIFKISLDFTQKNVHICV